MSGRAPTRAPQRRRAAVPGLIALLAGLAVPVLSPSPAGADPTTVVFEFTGGLQTFTVPDGVFSVYVEVTGGGGGDGAPGAETGVPRSAGAAGGPGAVASALVPVSPGDTLDVLVGAVGATPTFDWEGSGCYYPGGYYHCEGAAGGFGGGGQGGGANVENWWHVDDPNDATLRYVANVGGGGGGRSEVSIGGTPLVIAGGGGGGGGGDAWWYLRNGSGGGAGGYPNGTAGGATAVPVSAAGVLSDWCREAQAPDPVDEVYEVFDNEFSREGCSGQGGTQAAGGAGGESGAYGWCCSSAEDGEDGAARVGGAGGGTWGAGPGGGGGGGGYYGGGGGGAGVSGCCPGGGGGGGGGSSYADSSIATKAFGVASAATDGRVTISTGGLLALVPPPPIDRPSERCENRGGQQIQDGTTAGVRTWVYVHQPSSGEVDVCFRVQDASEAGYGGMIALTPTVPEAGPGDGWLQDPDNNSGACTTTTDPPNQVPGAHPVASGGLLSQPYLLDAYANDSEAWVCVRVGTGHGRIIVPLTAPSVEGDPGYDVTWYPDEGTPGS